MRLISNLNDIWFFNKISLRLEKSNNILRLEKSNNTLRLELYWNDLVTNNILYEQNDHFEFYILLVKASGLLSALWLSVCLNWAPF